MKQKLGSDSIFNPLYPPDCMKAIYHPLIVLVLFLTASNGKAPANPRVLDVTFGTGGKVAIPVGVGSAAANAMVLQSDGKILSAGYAYDRLVDFALVRYTATGALDLDFGTDGKVTTPNGQASSIAVQSDGKIVIAGSASFNGRPDFAVVRYTASGSLDPSFGTGGRVHTDFDDSVDRVRSVALQSDGKILVAGDTRIVIGNHDFAMVRYTASGALDTSFGQGGKVTTDFGGLDYGLYVALQQDGRILVVGGSQVFIDNDGNTRDSIRLVRYLTTGERDPSFGTSGSGISGVSPVCATLQSDGRILVAGVVAGPRGWMFSVTRFLSSGQVDTSFGRGGSVITAIGSNAIPSSIAIQNDGKIIVAGTAPSGSADPDIDQADLVLVRYTARGALDTSFGVGGKIRSDFGRNEVLNSITVQNDGKVLVAGRLDSNFLLVRYTAVPDRVIPQARIAAPQNSDQPGFVNLSGSVKENTALVSFTVKLNGVDLPLDAPLNFVPGAAVQWSVADVQLENGSNTVIIEAMDMNGNQVTVRKTLTYVNIRPELAGTYHALLVPEDVPGNDTTGLIAVKVTSTGIFTGKARLGGVSKAFSGVLRNDGSARFVPALGDGLPLVDRSRPLGTLAFSISEAAGLTGTLIGAGGTLATFTGRVAPHHARNPVPMALLNQPVTGSPLKGVYTVVFPSKDQLPTVDASTYPRGDGYATLTLQKTGAIALAGSLADGTKYSAAGTLRSDTTVVLFTSLYGNKGALSGELTFASLPDTDVGGLDFLWLRPNLSAVRTPPKAYAAGWPSGLRVDAAGAKFAWPASLDFGQGDADVINGNASLLFTEGLLTGSVSKPVSVNPATGAVKLIPATDRSYQLSLNPASGVINGFFPHSDGNKPRFSGILLNKGTNRGGFGYFLSTPTRPVPSQSGRIFLDPQGL